MPYRAGRKIEELRGAGPEVVDDNDQFLESLFPADAWERPSVIA
jgi:hypothetical protein